MTLLGAGWERAYGELYGGVENFVDDCDVEKAAAIFFLFSCLSLQCLQVHGALK
jgi:hypothetical protein